MRVPALNRLFESLAELLSSKRPNSIQSESEGDAILKPRSDVERVVLNSHGTTIERESGEEDRAHHWGSAGRSAVFEVEKHRCPAEDPTATIA